MWKYGYNIVVREIMTIVLLSAAVLVRNDTVLRNSDSGVIQNHTVFKTFK